MEAHEHGLLVMYGDMTLRRIFPRFFTYSADYPEKVLLSCIKFLGKHPCPWCLITKDNIHKMGSKIDRLHRKSTLRTDSENRQSAITKVRDWIFRLGRPVNSSTFEPLLGPESAVPIQVTCINCSLQVSRLISNRIYFLSAFFP